MLKAIRKFDPERSPSLSAYIRYALQYEILNIKRRYKPHGVTGIPKGYKVNFVYINNELPDGSTYELPADNDLSAVDMSELLNSLTDIESEAVRIKMRGRSLRRKAHITALDSVRRRYTELCAA